MAKKTKKNPSGFSSNVPVKNRKGQWAKFTTEHLRELKPRPQVNPFNRKK